MRERMEGGEEVLTHREKSEKRAGAGERDDQRWGVGPTIRDDVGRERNIKKNFFAKM
jgi:hypothetical protein